MVSSSAPNRVNASRNGQSSWSRNASYGPFSTCCQPELTFARASDDLHRLAFVKELDHAPTQFYQSWNGPRGVDRSWCWKGARCSISQLGSLRFRFGAEGHRPFEPGSIQHRAG